MYVYFRGGVMELLDSQVMERSLTMGEESVVSSSVPAESGSASVAPRRFDVVLDSSRDARLTEFGKDTLKDRYLLPGESVCLCR